MIDGKLILHEAVLTVTAANKAAGGNYIDFEVAYPNLGKGRGIEIIGVAIDAIVIASTGSLIFYAQESDDNASSDAYVDMDGCTSETYAATTTAISTIAAGTELFRFMLPNVHERYIRMVYTVGTVDLTTGGKTMVYLQPRS